MKLDQFIIPEFVLCRADNINTKKQALQKISDIISHADNRLKYTAILDALLQREKLGSTAIGKGAAIPHARVSNVKHPICVAMTLPKAIDFDSEDKQAVDLIFGLVVPEEARQEHLDILSSLASQLSHKEYRERLRKSMDNDQLYQSLISH